MVGTLLMRGMLVGILAGLIAFGFARLVGEPQVDRAIAFEESAHKAAPMAGHDSMQIGASDRADGQREEELVSRDTQRGLGLFTGVVAYGMAIGGLFALVFAYAYGRAGSLGPRELSALIAAMGFIAIVLVPDLKYPANPPAVGNPETIGPRTALYFGMILCSLAAMIAATIAWRRLAARHGRWIASLGAGALFVVLIAAAQTILPDVNEVPEAFPAVVLWQFRVAALGMQAIDWTVLALAFGWLTERSLQSRFGFVRPAAR